jgi:hypothetical protein
LCKWDSADGLLVWVGHAVGELDGEVAQGAWPVEDRLGPFGADVFEAQIEELENRGDGGEKIPVAANLAKRVVERFDGVG